MNPKQIKKILDDHKLWLEDKGGKRADLRGANLEGADLRGANFKENQFKNSFIDEGYLKSIVRQNKAEKLRKLIKDRKVINLASVV